MEPRKRLLSSIDLKENYINLQVFAEGLATTTTLQCLNLLAPASNIKPLYHDKEFVVKHWHVSPLWLNNQYSNNLN